jgi:hypothetical protein
VRFFSWRDVFGKVRADWLASRPLPGFTIASTASRASVGLSACGLGRLLYPDPYIDRGPDIRMHISDLLLSVAYADRQYD